MTRSRDSCSPLASRRSCSTRSRVSIRRAAATWSFRLFPRLRYPAASIPTEEIASCSSQWWTSSVAGSTFISSGSPSRNRRQAAPSFFPTSPERIRVSMCAMLIFTTCLLSGPSKPTEEVKSLAFLLERLTLLLLSMLLTVFPPLASFCDGVCCGARLKPPELDEPHGGVLVEGRPARVGRQLEAVEGVRRRPPDHPHPALVELELDLPRDPPL